MKNPGWLSAAPAQTLQQEVTEHEGSSVREAHLREVQDHPPQGQGHGDLRESQAQAEAGLIPQARVFRGKGMLASACLLHGSQKSGAMPLFCVLGMVDVDFLPCYDREKEE